MSLCRLLSLFVLASFLHAAAHDVVTYGGTPARLSAGIIAVSNEGTDGIVCAAAVQLIEAR
ncbi:MAG: hypothetical protein U1F71_18180 [Verrucomicrobiaceae bacterium]